MNAPTDTAVLTPSEQHDIAAATLHGDHLVTQTTDLAPATGGALVTAPTPADLLRIAVEQNADMAKLEKLMDLQERWEANEARKAFVVAMAGFKSEPLVIEKHKQVSFNDVSYKHAELSDVTAVVCPALSKHGLSHRWDVAQEAGQIRVTCILTHVKGHSESLPMSGPPDASGKKNAIQQIASTVTYLQRYTLLAITGLSTQGVDDDGRGSEIEFVSEKQAATIRDMVEATGTDLPKFLEYLDAESIETIPAKSFDKAMAALKAKERAARGKAA